MLTIIPLVIIIISLGVILIIAVRHLPQAAALDVSSLPEEREARLKSSILERRLLRKANNIWNKIAVVFFPIVKISSNWYKAGVKKIRSLERTYRFHIASPLPDTSQKSELKLQALVDKARSALEAGKLGEAESDYLEILKLNPSLLEAYDGLGKIYIKRQEWEQARETFEYITKTWPANDQAFALLALVEEVSGHLEKAMNLYLHALSINNNVLEYHLNLAEVYQSLGENEKSLSSLQKAQALEPNNPKVLDQLLQVSILLGNKSLAEEVLDKIKKVNPDHGKLGELEEKVKSLT